MYQKHLNIDHVNGLLILITFFTVLLANSSCAYLPLPAHDLLSKKGVINKKIIKSLKPGETTREDLLLQIGAPDERHEQDRYFIYYWVATEGMFAIGFVGGNYIERTHYFCVEFDEGNRIKRLEHIKSGLFKSAFKARDEMNKWMHVTEQ